MLIEIDHEILPIHIEAEPLLPEIHKPFKSRLRLAAGTIMSSPPSQDDAADGRSAYAAGLAFPAINAVLDLERALAPVRMDIIRNRGSAGANSGLENSAQSGMEPSEFLRRKPARAPGGTNPGPEETLVGIDVSNAGHKRLIQECGFDCELASTKQGGELVRVDRQRVKAGSKKTIRPVEVTELQPAKATRIDKAQLTAALK